MANISILDRCNRRCSYCFSQGSLSGAKMSLSKFSEILQRLDEEKNQEEEEIRFLGGEPTLHPDLPAMIERAAVHGWKSIVFTNGWAAPVFLKRMKAVSTDQVLFVVHITGEERNNDLPPRLKAFLQSFADRAMLGWTISARRPPLLPLLDLIDSFGLLRSLRLGLAHPIYRGDNRFLPPKFYRETGLWLSEFLQTAKEREVAIHFDCGFVPCMFEGEGQDIFHLLPADLGRRCNPLPDILADGSLIPCFPLAKKISAATWPEGETLKGVRAGMAEKLKTYQTLGVFPYCRRCVRRIQGSCLGGCRAVALRRLAAKPLPDIACHRSSPWEQRQIYSYPHREEEGQGSSRIEDRAAKSSDVGWVIPYIDQPVEFWERLAEEYGATIREVYFPFPEDRPIGSGRPSQPQVHLRNFLRRSRLGKSLLLNPILLPRAVEEIIPLVLPQLRELMDISPLVGVTVSSVPLGAAIRKAFPALRLTASTLLDICTPFQVAMLEDIFDVLVPSSRIFRNLAALRALRQSFRGALRLIVNEGCLPGCVFRTQHFYEMSCGSDFPRSLCEDFLSRHPQQRLTGAWVLPQHLHLYRGLFDELKLAGRVTLQEPETYRKVLGYYIRGISLPPHQIGGGPAAVREPMEVSEELFRRLLSTDDGKIP